MMTNAVQTSMREILFRGKRIDNGEWVEGSFLIARDYLTDILLHIIASNPTLFPHSEVAGCDNVDPATVGQYTGRMDRNRKRVFEGDILRMFSIWANGKVEPVEVPVVVQFSENDQCYVLVTKEGLRYDDFGNYGKPEYYEVIGNIHNNPEL